MIEMLFISIGIGENAMNKTRCVAVSVIILTLISSSVLALDVKELFSGIKPYVGANAQVRRMDYKAGFGDNLLQHHSPQGNLYGGLKFREELGLEAGYEATSTRTRTVGANTGDVINGTTLSALNSPSAFKSKHKIKGPHVDLMGYYSFPDRAPVQLLGGIGVSFVKTTFARTTLAMGGVPMNFTRTFSAHKALLRLTGGLQYNMNENWGGRLTVGWVNTSRMLILADDNGRGNPMIKPKNSFVYGLGTLWNF